VLVGKYTAVRAIFLDSVLVTFAKLFVSLFPNESFMGICRFLEMRKDKVSGNINKECACGVMAKGPMTTHCVGEARTSSNHLVNTAHFTWLKWLLTNWLRIAKRMALSFAILAFMS